MKTDPDARARRVANEQAFHHRIAASAEVVWNWASPAGRRRAARRAGFFAEAARGAARLGTLELGCGSGVFLERVAASGASVVAVDLSAELIGLARTKLQPGNVVAFCCANAEALPFPDGTFELVYGSSILHHLDLPAALAELHRVLRPGGRLVFAEPNLLNPQIALSYRLLPRSWSDLTPDEQAFTRFAAVRALRRAGFVDVESRPYDFLHPATPARLVDAVERLSRQFERIPLLREIAGSQVLRGRRA